MLTPTSRTTPEDIILADKERCRQAFWLALKESGPYPDDLADIVTVRRWRRAVHRLHRRIWKRFN